MTTVSTLATALVIFAVASFFTITYLLNGQSLAKDELKVNQERNYVYMEYRDEITLIERQLELKRKAHEIQNKAGQSYRERCVAMTDDKLIKLNTWVEEGIVLWWMYENTYQCTVDQRMGISGDGGKWICNPDVFASKPCVLYSFGVKDDFSFETEVNWRIGCSVRMFDPTIEVEPVRDQLSRLKDVKIERIGAADNNSVARYKTISTLMSDNGHEYVDILKIDIEGSEQVVFREFFETHNKKMKKLYPGSKPGDHPFATIILCELHYRRKERWPETKFKANFDYLYGWFDFFKLMEEQGYVIYHKEVNMYVGRNAEYAWVHLATMERLEKDFYLSTLV